MENNVMMENKMGIDLRKRNFIALKDFSEREILYLIDLSEKFK